MRWRSTFVFLILSALVHVANPAAGQIMPGSTPGTFQGPGSTRSPYVVPVSTAPGWVTAAVISVGDAADNGYTMAGIPDGLGALAGRFRAGRHVDDRRYLTVFMNHEIPAGNGIPRAHGQNGAFVSQWTIHLDSLRVRRGEDLIQQVFAWDAATGQHLFAPAVQFGRLCSADLPALTAFFNPHSRRGFEGRLLMNGEETGAEGRGFAHVVTGPTRGTTYELPHLGRFSWENSVAHPKTGDRTVVVGLDDSTPGQVYVYVGTKRKTGNPVERAGLVGGKLYGIKVTNGGANYSGGPVTRENNGPIAGTFVLTDVTPDPLDPTDFGAGSGTKLQTRSVARGVTEFARPEDGAWDTRNPRVFYFVVTGATIDGKGQSARLYKLTFDNPANPTRGTIELIVDRAALTPPGQTEPTFAQFDNITVDGDGAVLIQEDPGNTPYIARTWKVNPVTRTATAVLQSDPERFGAPAKAPFNVDEESSGIIEVTSLVRSAWWFDRHRRYFLADLQAHYLIPGELVEGGQLYLVASPRSHRHHDHDDDDDDHRDKDDRDDHRHN
jgi:hypothetical protein